MKSRKNLLLLVALALLAAGCFKGCEIVKEGSVGEMGKAKFAWDEGILTCFMGCDAGEAMASQAIAYLQVVNSDEIPAFTVSSDNPGVAEFFQESEGSSLVRVESHLAGEAKLIMTVSGSTGLVDRFTVTVRDVAAIELGAADVYRQRLTIAGGGSETFYLNLEDAGGHELVGIGAVDYTLQDGLTDRQAAVVSALDDWLGSVIVGTAHEYFMLMGRETGSGSIAVAPPSGSPLVIPVEVVDGSLITSVELSHSCELRAGSSCVIDALAAMGAERVYSPACLWELSPPDGPVTIDYEGRDTLQVKSDQPASADVTCAAGSATGSLTVTFR